jgi:hypothetical protein
LHGARDHLRKLEALVQHKSESELALEIALREVPLSISNIERALDIAKNTSVSDALIKHASDILNGLIISDAERKLAAATSNINIDLMESLKQAVQYANDRNVDSYKINEARQLLLKVEKFIETLNAAIDSKEIDVIEDVLINACNLNLEGVRIVEASQLLKELRQENATDRLAFAVSEVLLIISCLLTFYAE